MGNMIDIICALCGEKQQIKTLYPSTFNEKMVSKSTYSARRFPDKIHYRIVKCQNCSLVFSSPVLPPGKILMLYKESVCNYKEQIPYLIKTYLNIIKKIKSDIAENPKVLEVGCGNGFFLKALLDCGLTKEVFGVEPGSKMVLHADEEVRSRIKVNFFKQNLFPKSTFDLILCFHVLDHMIDPNEFIRGAQALLKKNGYIIVVVHDTEGLSVKLFQEKSAIFDIEHIYLFNRKTLSKIFLRNKFKVVQIFNLINSYPLDYWIKMSGFPSFIKKSSKFITTIFGINKKSISIPAGNIGIIAKKS